MSAECDVCGADLVYGDDDWPQGHCDRCLWRDHAVEAVRALRNVQWWHGDCPLTGCGVCGPALDVLAAPWAKEIKEKAKGRS